MPLREMFIFFTDSIFTPLALQIDLISYFYLYRDKKNETFATKNIVPFAGISAVSAHVLSSLMLVHQGLTAVFFHCAFLHIKGTVECSR